MVDEEVIAEKTDEIYCVPKKEKYSCKVHGSIKAEALSKEVDVKKVLVLGEHTIRRASIHPEAFSIVFSERPLTKKVDEILEVK